MRITRMCLAGCLALCGCSSSHAAQTHETRAATAEPQPSTQWVQQPANGAILNAATGRRVASVTTDGPITAAVTDGHGGWYIGGGFTRVDGHPRATLAHIRASGALDASWHPRPLRPQRMLPFVSLARAGHRIFVAGGYQVPPHGHLGGAMALNAAGGAVVRTWRPPNPCGSDWVIRTGGGRVWIGTACAAGICLFGARTTTGTGLGWNPRIAAIGEIGCLNDMAVAHDEVYFTGGFTAVGGAPRPGVAAVSVADGRVDAAFAPRGGCATDGHALALNAHLIYVGGDGCPVAALDATTGKQVWAWPRQGNTMTNALLATPTRVYVGGSFGTLAGVVANGLLALNARTGVAEPSWHPASGSEVFAIAQSGGRVLVGGQ